MPQIKSPALAVEKEKSQKKSYTPNADQQEMYAFYIQKFEKAKEQRAQKRPEFDNLTYEDDYELNKKISYSFLTPKQNDDEIRIVTGMTEKKIDVVFNELVGLNLQPEINAFDIDDNEYRELGQDFTDIVSRTNKIEKDDDFWEAFIRELITQRAAYFEEVDDYEIITNRGKLRMNENGGDIEKKDAKITIHRAKKRALSGLQVYLGDISIPAYRFDEQPFIVKYARSSYEDAHHKYSTWKKWEFVRPGASTADQPYGYRMNALNDDEIEELHFINPHGDEYMLMINGVMMFDEPAPLPYEITCDRKYNIRMIVLKGISDDFAYGKPLTASAKTLQGVNNEVIRLLIRKFRQAIEPPLAVASAGKVYSKDIWTAGAVSYGVKASDFQMLNPNNQGVTTSEFNIFDLIERKTEEFIGVPNIAQGIGVKGEQTATEILNQQKNFIKALGLSVLAVMKAKREATYLRIYNLLDNFTQPVGKKYDAIEGNIVDVYNKWTINDGQFSDGKTGKKIVQMMNRDLTQGEKEDIYAYEQEQDSIGKPTRIRTVNVEKLMSFVLFWFVTVVQKERDGSALNKVMFTDKLKQAAGVAQLTGRQLNPDKIVEEFEYTWQVKNFFQKQPAMAMAGGGGEMAQKGQELMGEINSMEQSIAGDQMKQGQGMEQANKPSLNTMGNA